MSDIICDMTGNIVGLTGVQEVLIPYTEFAPSDLAQQLSSLVIANTELLNVRGIHGVVSRYSNLETAEQKVRKGQAEHDSIGHFAVVNALGYVRGAASIYPELPLKKQRLPLPPILARGPLVDTFTNIGPNLHAWTDQDDIDLLASAYNDLVNLTTICSSITKIWTVEPTRSPEDIHQAIIKSGLRKVATRRFDDGESRRRIPPRSTLYTRF